MDYQNAWGYLKDWLYHAVDEGVQRGYDRDFYQDNLKQVGMFEAYSLALREMSRLEK
jgi:hypothetical protein